VRFPAAVMACVIALAATVPLADLDPMAMAAGVYRKGRARLQSGQSDVTFYRDGETASIAVIKNNDGELIISTNGKADASIQVREDVPPTVDELTMVTAAALPLATHPAPQTAAVIGFDPACRRTPCWAIPACAASTRSKSSRQWSKARRHSANARAFDDPRSHIDYDDAKAYFASRLERYDIIISEPSNPWVSGVGGLFSKEFYEFIPRHLNPGGCSCSGSSCTRSTRNSWPRSGVPWRIVHRFPRLSGQRHRRDHHGHRRRFAA
jgi:hypothetical protein